MTTMQTLHMMLGATANVLVLLLLAPLCEGLARKLTALVQSRRGPPIWQPYLDLLKLLGKEDIESGESPAMQRLAAYLALAAPLAVGAVVPMGLGTPLAGSGDGILLVALLTLCSVCALVAGLAAGSTYSLLGVSREMMTMIGLEPLLAAAVVVAAVRGGSLAIEPLLDGAIYHGGISLSGTLALAVIALAFPAFVQRPPFDVAEAETEIMEGALMEYSGPKLALFRAARAARLALYAGIFVGLFLPWGSSAPPPLGWLLFWLKTIGVVAAVTLVAATHARVRVDQQVRFFAALLAVALAAVALAGGGL